MEQDTVASIHVIEDLAVKNSYYLEISDNSGAQLIGFNAMGESSVLKNNSLVRSQVVYTLLVGQERDNILFFEDTQSSTTQGYYICGVRTTIAGQDRLVLTETALAPWEKRWMPFGTVDLGEHCAASGCHGYGSVYQPLYHQAGETALPGHP